MAQAETNKYYLLLEDVKGLELRNLLPMKIPITVPKGEILTPKAMIVTKGRHLHNYCLTRDSSVTLYCLEDEVVPLNNYEFKLLEAIQSRSNRYQVYSKGLLKWGAELRPNDQVLVRLRSKSKPHTSIKFPGIVGSVGALLASNKGFWFQIKLKREDYSDCDFCFGERPFIYHDDKHHLVMVSLDKLHKPTINNEVEPLNDQLETLTPLNNTLAALQDQPQEEKNFQQYELEEKPTNHSHQPQQVDHEHLPDPSLEVQSRVQIPSSQPGEEYQYGVIRWIGVPCNGKEQLAGIELDEKTAGCTDGTHRKSKKKYFKCPPGRGIYYPFHLVKHDARFMDDEVHMNPLDYVKEVESEDQTRLCKDQIKMYIGDERGIQGHHNSCFIDATLFGLFAVSTEFDEPFLEEFDDPVKREISHLLWKGIVNPLRKNHVVKLDSVVKLRDELDKVGRLRGITQEEKDPEEFLNMLFKYTLQVPPFISIRRPFGVEEEYFVQLFMEPDKSLVLPTVGDLLKRMFQEQSISFTEVPPKLLIQVPRFGRQFKTFQAIIAEPFLNVRSLVDGVDTVSYKCSVCEQPAKKMCTKCSVCESKTTSSYFCNDKSCWDKVHTAADSEHMQQLLCNDQPVCQQDIYEMELLSVICIETSHYVCFTRSDDQWVFFDSMANRVYDLFNIPKVIDCSDQLNKWVFPADGDRTKLKDTHTRNLPEYVRRFTQDVYLCVYVRTMCKVELNDGQ